MKGTTQSCSSHTTQSAKVLMFKFLARFEPAPEGGFVVTFRDVPEAITQGDTLEEARAMAVDALVTSMDFYLEDGREVPRPSCEVNRPGIREGLV